MLRDRDANIDREQPAFAAPRPGGAAPAFPAQRCHGRFLHLLEIIAPAVERVVPAACRFAAQRACAAAAAR